MEQRKKKRLESKGWAVSDAATFAGLSPQESAYVEMKVALAVALQKRRQAKHVSQTALAEAMGSSQSRVAKMEKGDASVSLDLLVRSLFALGGTAKDVAKAIARRNV
jgi:predicted XRE-type DNA-binding protein